MYQKVTNTYGIELRSNAPLSQLDYELVAFRLCRDGVDVGLGAEEHFIRAAEILWPPTCSKPFIWNDQARFLLKKYCEEKVLAVTGHGSSSKTALSAIWALVNSFADPNDVMVIVVSTDIEGASQSRIYGQIKDFFFAVDGGKMPFKLNQSAKTLSPFDPNKLIRFSSSAGIKLVSGNANKEKEAEAKIKGYKIGGVNPGKIILIIDEGCDVAAGVYKTYFSNLAGNRRAQLIALANYRPNNAFADLAEPDGGWATVEPTDQFWKTTRGGCVHLDGLQNPNYLAQENIYPFLQNFEHVNEFYERGLEDTAEFWEQVRAFPPPAGVNDGGVYDEAELVQFGADQPVRDGDWDGRPITGGGFDGAYTEGGDKCMFYPIRGGFIRDGTFVIEALQPIEIIIRAGEGQKAGGYQVLDWMLDYCEGHGEDKEMYGYDATDINFKAIVQGNGGKDFTPVAFHGESTDRQVLQPVGKEPPKKNNEVFANRVSELWGVGRAFVRSGQFRGIRGQLKTEMVARKWGERVNHSGKRLYRVESKKEMKKRMKRKSPDTADAFFIGLDVFISKLRLKVGMPPFTRDHAKALREKLLARGRISPKTLARGGGRSFASSMFDGRAIKRLRPLDDPTKMRLL